MTRSEDKMIGYCGYNCYLCAARLDDIDTQKKLVDAWRKYLGHQYYTAENVACDGCKSEGDKIADKQCKARPCARVRGFESCAQCDEFPCKKMSHLMESTAGLLIFLASQLKDITEEDSTSAFNNGTACLTSKKGLLRKESCQRLYLTESSWLIGLKFNPNME